jgi:hypothetical protein
VAANDEHGNEVLGYTKVGNYLPDGVLHSQGGPYAKELEGILRVHHCQHTHYQRDFILDRLY